MGGERFEATNPEYLFGENCDLNYLSCVSPLSFPYKQSQNQLIPASGKRSNNRANLRSNSSRGKTINHLKSRNSKNHLPKNPQPSQALKCFINVRKETLRLTRADTFIEHQSHRLGTNDTLQPQASCDAEVDDNVLSSTYNKGDGDDFTDQNHEIDRQTSYHPLRKSTIPASLSSDGIRTTIDMSTATCAAVRRSCHNLEQGDSEQDNSDITDHTKTKRYSRLNIQDCSRSDGPSTDELDQPHEKKRDRRIKPNGNVMYQNYQPVIDLEQIDNDAPEKENNSTNSDTSRSIPSNLNSEDGKERSTSLLKESTSAQNVVGSTTGVSTYTISHPERI